MTNEPNLTQHKSQTVTEMQAELYDEVVKWYRVENEQVIKLRHALTQVNNLFEDVTGLEYEDYLKNKLYKLKYELTRQLSLATNKSQVCD